MEIPGTCSDDHLSKQYSILLLAENHYLKKTIASNRAHEILNLEYGSEFNNDDYIIYLKGLQKAKNYMKWKNSLQ